MALWAMMMASPLIMSNDLRNIAPEFREILLNRQIIAVSKDRLGLPGKHISEVLFRKVDSISSSF